MVKTLQPGEGDDFSIEAEIEAFRSMLDAFDDERFTEIAKPIGRLALERDVFGRNVTLPPFDPPTHYNSFMYNQSNN